ncbi:radical SAM protein [Thermosulfuriphilus sp.]
MVRKHPKDPVALKVRAQRLKEALACCELCPRGCRVNRHQAEQGFCGLGARPVVSGYMPHFGEEACLVGEKGSGAIFFSGCNLACIFCQTYEISQLRQGEEIEVGRLAEIMLELKESGCHNINLVTPSHQVPVIVEALAEATEQGLDLPVVYNTGGYDSPETLKQLEGIVDIYLPDFKIWDEEIAKRLLKAADYPYVARRAILEMHRQVGELAIGPDGLARRGLLVRHLILPGGLAGSFEILRFLAEEVSPHTYLNLMGHYHPQWQATRTPPLDRPITKEEFKEVWAYAQNLGLRLDKTHLPLLEVLWQAGQVSLDIQGGL